MAVLSQAHSAPESGNISPKRGAYHGLIGGLNRQIFLDAGLSTVRP